MCKISKLWVFLLFVIFACGTDDELLTGLGDSVAPTLTALLATHDASDTFILGHIGGSFPPAEPLGVGETFRFYLFNLPDDGSFAFEVFLNTKTYDEDVMGLDVGLSFAFYKSDKSLLKSFSPIAEYRASTMTLTVSDTVKLAALNDTLEALDGQGNWQEITVSTTNANVPAYIEVPGEAAYGVVQYVFAQGGKKKYLREILPLAGLDSRGIDGDVSKEKLVLGISMRSRPLVGHTTDDGFSAAHVEAKRGIYRSFGISSTDTQYFSPYLIGELIDLKNNNAQVLVVPQGWTLS